MASLRVSTANLRLRPCICYQQYLQLPKRKLPLARDSEMMERREIIYMKRINQIRAVCEKYKKMDLNDFKSYFTAILT